METSYTVYEWNGYWTRDDVEEHKDLLFIFGDNDIKKGTRGQAVIRGLPNTAGIPTQKNITRGNERFYTDDEYKENRKKIKSAILLILKRIQEEKYVGIVLPRDGIGTGLSQLYKKAPKTFEYLQYAIKKYLSS